MTTPSAFLDKVVEVLKEKLGETVRTVAKHPGRFGGDGKEFWSLATPGVLVACIGAPATEPGYEPAVATLSLVAFCVARIGKGTSDQDEYAMDLAATVAAIVSTERWDGEGYGTAASVAWRNEFSERLADKGVAMWSVAWQQQIELDPAQQVPDLLNSLKRIHFTFVAGIKDVPGNDTDDDTDDIEAQAELTGAPVP